MLIRPNAAQSAMMTSGFGTRPAMVGGVRKMPLPIVMPIMSAVPLEKPMTLRRSCVTALILCLVEMVVSHTHKVSTTGQGDAHDLTPVVARLVGESGIDSGIVTI